MKGFKPVCNLNLMNEKSKKVVFYALKELMKQKYLFSGTWRNDWVKTGKIRLLL